MVLVLAVDLGSSFSHTNIFPAEVRGEHCYENGNTTNNNAKIS